MTTDTPPEQQRYAQKRSFPKTVLSEQHTINCKVLPNRQSLLRSLPSNGVAAEVGVAFGDFSQEIIQLNQPEKLYLVDLWEGDRYSAGLEKVEAVLSQEIASGKVEIRRGRSVEVLSTFPDDFFDWVYIDTDHSYHTTFSELTTVSRKMKPGGIIAGHDFCSGNVVKPVPYGVVEACTKFAKDFGWEFCFLTLESDGHFSFAIKKLA